MAKMDQVRKHMNMILAMRMYGVSDKERFDCAYPEYQEKRPSSTFYADFSVADVYGEKAIQDTYNRAFNEWKGDYKMLTELVAALNHKIWFWFEAGIEDYATLYDRLYKEADAYGVDNLKGEELAHFYRVLD